MAEHLAYPEPTAAEAKAAQAVSDRIKGHVRMIRRAWLLLAEDLYAFHIAEQWRELGYPSFNAYLNDPEIEVEKRHAHYLIELWRELVIKREVDPKILEDVGVSKVQVVLPSIRRGYVDIPDALADAKTLSRDDLRKEYAGRATEPGAGTGAPARNDRHLDPDDEPEYARCEACGSTYLVKR